MKKDLIEFLVHLRNGIKGIDLGNGMNLEKVWERKDPKRQVLIRTVNGYEVEGILANFDGSRFKFSQRFRDTRNHPKTPQNEGHVYVAIGERDYVEPRDIHRIYLVRKPFCQDYIRFVNEGREIQTT